MPQEKWLRVTKRLVASHPLDPKTIVDLVLESWVDIFASKIGNIPFRIGKDIFPKPQIMGFLLHELIPLKLELQDPQKWCHERTAKDKDIIYLPDEGYSVEIKTSSDPKSIFGNRSYAQKTEGNKKAKSGYYLAVNFQKFSDDMKNPGVLKIRFGWLDHEDWMGQKAATGQQSRISSSVEALKLLEIYSAKK